MRFVLSCVVMSTVLFVIPALSMGQQDKTENAFVKSALKRHDKNSDGSITADEAGGQLKKNFNRVDSDDNGEIGKAELVALEKVLKRQNAGRENRKKASIPDTVELKTDVAYREGNSKWKVDLVLPKSKSDKPRAAIIFIHGGGWSNGDKAGGVWRSLPISYAEEGYVCMSVNYRLLSDKKSNLSDCIADCKCAVRWLRANASEYNVDPDRIGAYGGSAGAHLVSMLGLTTKADGMEGDGPHQEHSSQVQAVCCAAPPTDFLNWSGRQKQQGAKALERLFSGSEDKMAWAKKASPITHVGSDSPPFLIIHGTADRTVPVQQADDLNEALKNAKAKDVTYLRFEGAGHGVFGQRSKKTYPAMKEFFKRTIGER
ncbi:MAG: alpha/beta hydrolase fold domain-containing protein [Mariniblastus sp.]